MHTTFGSLLLLSASATSLLGCAAPGENVLGTEHSVVTNPLPAPDALHYVGGGVFDRTVDRQISSTNSKQFPFRVENGTNVTVDLTWLGIPAGSGWGSSRPSSYDLQFSADGVTWPAANTGACHGTATSAAPQSCTTAATGDWARVVMTTTQGTSAQGDKAHFQLHYSFSGPVDASEYQLPESQASTSGLTLSATSTAKAHLAGSTTLLPQVLEGQGVRLEITRSHANVLVEPNGPKLKWNSNPQYDGTDFVCSDWGTGPSGAGTLMICEVQGAATRDSTIHVPFQIQPGTSSTGRSGSVRVLREYVTGYVQGTACDPSVDGGTCF